MRAVVLLLSCLFASFIAAHVASPTAVSAVTVPLQILQGAHDVVLHFLQIEIPHVPATGIERDVLRPQQIRQPRDVLVGDEEVVLVGENADLAVGLKLRRDVVQVRAGEQIAHRLDARVLDELRVVANQQVAGPTAALDTSGYMTEL